MKETVLAKMDKGLLELEFYDLAGQKRRGHALRLRVAELGLPSFNGRGEFIAQDKVIENYQPGKDLPTREKMWYALAFLDAGDEGVQKANKIIENFHSPQNIADSFTQQGVIQILLHFKDKLSDICCEMLLTSMRIHCDRILSPKNIYLAYNGINDNFPSMDAAAGIIGGQLTGHTGGYEKGIELMGQLKDLLSRRGVISEYNSPTYSSHTLQAMADIAEHAGDPAVQKLALALEERMHLDILSHYHPLLCCPAGPYSRAYMVDSCGHTHQARTIYTLLFGDKMPVNTENTLLSGPSGLEGEVMHAGIDFMWADVAYHTCTTYHVPAYLAEMALLKPFPFVITATTECRARRDNNQPEIIYPGGSGSIYTYMTEYYGIGSATRDFSSGGQTNGLHILYGRRPVHEQRDINTVFTKYIVNDADPNFDAVPDMKFGLKGVNDFQDAGRKRTFQKKNTALTVYKPKEWALERISSLKLSIIMPIHYGLPEKVWLDGKEIKWPQGDGVAAENAEPCEVIIKDGPVYMGFKPTALTNHGRACAVKIEVKSFFLLISFINYEGKPKDFTLNELSMTANGVVTEIRDETEIADFAAMKQIMDDIKITDKNWVFDGMETEREIRVSTMNGTFEMVYEPQHEAVRRMLIDGRIPASPVFQATGLDVKKIPFYQDEWMAERGL